MGHTAGLFSQCSLSEAKSESWEECKSKASQYRTFSKDLSASNELQLMDFLRQLVSSSLILNTLDKMPFHNLKQCLLNQYKPLMSVAAYGKKFCSLTECCVKTTSLICSEHTTC